jgi:hypothetical protein
MDQKHGQLAAQSEVVAPPAAAFGRPLTVAQRKALEVVRSIAASDSFVGGVAGWFPAPDLGRVAEKLGGSKDEARRLADALIAKRAIIECVSCQRKIWRIATQSEGVSIRERGFGASKQRAPRRPKEAKAKAESKPAPASEPEPEPSPAPPLPPQAPKPEIKATPQRKLRRPRREAKKVKLSALKADWMNPKLMLAAVAKAHDFSDSGLRALAKRMGWPNKLAVRKFPRRADRIIEALHAGKDFDEMAAIEGCAKETLWNWCRRWRSQIMPLAEALAKAGFVQGPTRKS